jgi:hypothetical protein
MPAALAALGMPGTTLPPPTLTSFWTIDAWAKLQGPTPRRLPPP